MLERELEFYNSNREELVKKYRRKYIVLKEEAVIGVYDSEEEAFEKTIEEYEEGTFLIQYCE